MLYDPRVCSCSLKQSKAKQNKQNVKCQQVKSDPSCGMSCLLIQTRGLCWKPAIILFCRWKGKKKEKKACSPTFFFPLANMVIMLFSPRWDRAVVCCCFFCLFFFCCTKLALSVPPDVEYQRLYRIHTAPTLLLCAPTYLPSQWFLIAYMGFYFPSSTSSSLSAGSWTIKWMCASNVLLITL